MLKKQIIWMAVTKKSYTCAHKLIAIKFAIVFEEDKYAIALVLRDKSHLFIKWTSIQGIP